MRLREKVALITDAQNPCSQAIALGFAREGADCAVIAAEALQAEQLAAEIRILERRAVAIHADVTKKSEVEEFVRRAVAEFGRIDVLVNGSCIGREADFLTITEETFNECLDRGPKAYFLVAQAVGRQMAEQRSGKIINLSTTDARLGSGESAGSSAASSSIDAMTRAMAQALGFYGVNVNSLVTGPLDSFSGTAEEVGERIRRIPLGRLGKAEDIVGAAIFLATNDSDFVAGESLYVDAGYSNAAVTEDSFRPAWGRVWTPFEIPRSRK
jgi:NAD(P)-dependent dehydrogenase (short-subunit alcohol dehydrogenase family)